MLKKIYNNQKGMVAIMMTVLILSSILLITIVANDIIMNNLKMNIVQVNATKAFFASEAGIEKIMWKIRKESFDFTGCTNGQKIFFNDPLPSDICGAGDTLTLGNSASVTLGYSLLLSTTTITAFGVFGDTGRKTEIEY